MATIASKSTANTHAANPGWRTHEVTNQVDELSGHSLLATDQALREALERAGAAAFMPALSAYAVELGRPETAAIGRASCRERV